MPTNIVDSNSKMLLKLDATQGDRFANSGRQDSNLGANDFIDAMVVNPTSNPLERITGIQDDAVKFNGSQAIRLADHNKIDLGSASFAINLQMQTATNSEMDVILDKRDANGLGYALSNNNGQLQLTLKGSTGQTVINLNSTEFSNNVNSEDWQNITINVDRSSSSQVKAQLFVNGAPQTPNPIVQSIALGSLDNAAPLTIGAASQGMTGTGLNASLDNVRLLDRLMTTDEINRLARSELTNINPITNRVALWNLDEAAVGVAADSAGRNDLTHMNNPSIIQGKVDHAVQLNITGTNSLNDAAQQRLMVADNSSIDLGTSDFTIAAWIKSSNVTQLDKIIEKMGASPSNSQIQQGYSLYNDNGRIGLQLVSGTQNVKFELTGQQSSQVISSTSNSWQHLSVTVDRTANAIQEVKFFANGTLITATPQVSINGSALASMSSPVSMGSLDNISQLSIGSSSSTIPSNFLNGSLDEIQIAKSELSQTQIQDIVNPKELLVTNSLVSATRGLQFPNETRNLQLMGLTPESNMSQSDILTAGAGSDVLIGVNPIDNKPGLREIDQLTGNGGADKFVLGDTSKSHYLSDNLNAIGNRRGQLDYALIQDFRPSQGDKIELFGKANDYELKVITSGSQSQTEIYRNLSTTSGIGVNGDDLIALVKHDATALSLTNTNQFTFI